MSALSEKLHAILAHLKGEGTVMEHEIEDAVQAAIEHFTPVAEAIKADVTKTVTEAIESAKAEITALIAEIKAEVQGNSSKKFQEPQGMSDAPGAAPTA